MTQGEQLRAAAAVSDKARIDFYIRSGSGPTTLVLTAYHSDRDAVLLAFPRDKHDWHPGEMRAGRTWTSQERDLILDLPGGIQLRLYAWETKDFGGAP